MLFRKRCRVSSTGSPPPPPIAFDDQVLRAFRVLRLFGRLRRLRAIIGGITSSIRPVLNAFLIIFVVASICEGRSPASRGMLSRFSSLLVSSANKPEYTVLNAFLIIFVVASICEGRSPASRPGRSLGERRRVLPLYGGETGSCASILWRRKLGRVLPFYGGEPRPCAPILWRRNSDAQRLGFMVALLGQQLTDGPPAAVDR